MIHCIEKNVLGNIPSQKNVEKNLLSYVSLYDILEEAFLTLSLTFNEIVHKYTIIEQEKHLTQKDVEQYIENNNVSTLILTLEIFNMYEVLAIPIIKSLSEKYPHIKFMVSSYETQPTINIYESMSPNIFYIINGYHNLYDKNKFTFDNIINYYSMNVAMQNEYNTNMYKLFDFIGKMKRHKKYNFYNGIHKPHRLLCYDLIKKHKMLDEGFFSYVDFADMSKETSNMPDFVKFFGFPNVNEYLKYLNNFEIPYSCDMYEITQNIFVPFTLPPQYAAQSYISITTETVYTEDTSVILSEKSFKAFNSFNIPLIVGMPMANKYLTDLGFDMFSDFFDIEPKFSRIEIFKQFENNIKLIRDMSIKELHNFYVFNIDRIIHNFINLTKIQKNKDFNKILSFLNLNNNEIYH